MIYWCLSATHVNFNLSVTLWLFKKNPIKAQFPPTIHALFWESLTATTDETDDAFSVHTMPPCCPNIPVIAVSGWFTYLQRKTLDVSTPLLPSHHPQPRIFMNLMCFYNTVWQIRVMHIQNREYEHHNTICSSGSCSHFSNSHNKSSSHCTEQSWLLFLCVCLRRSALH